MATRVARSGGNDELLCMLLRHESDDMPYEYIDADLPGIRRTLEARYTIDEDEIDTELV